MSIRVIAVDDSECYVLFPRDGFTDISYELDPRLPIKCVGMSHPSVLPFHPVFIFNGSIIYKQLLDIISHKSYN